MFFLRTFLHQLNTYESHSQTPHCTGDITMLKKAKESANCHDPDFVNSLPCSLTESTLTDLKVKGKQVFRYNLRFRPRPFRFLDLPSELRHEVYGYVCNWDGIDDYVDYLVNKVRSCEDHAAPSHRPLVHSRVFGDARRTPSILLVNHQTHSEALYCLVRIPLRFSHQPIRKWTPYSDTLGQLMSPTLLRLVRTIELHMPEVLGSDKKGFRKGRHWRLLVKAIIEGMAPSHRSYELRTVYISVGTTKKLINMQDRDKVSNYAQTEFSARRLRMTRSINSRR